MPALLQPGGGSELNDEEATTSASGPATTARSISEGFAPGNPPGEGPARGAGVCVVIPALNEGAGIAAAVAHVRSTGGAAQVIVADGGSHDATVTHARRAGAELVAAPRGRGAQMNAGARASAAPVLLFLHADCRLPPEAFTSVHATLARGHEAGIFPIRYASAHPLLRIVGWLSHVESRYTSFGEGALFVRRDAFEQAGGFPDWPLFEDVELRARLRRRGPIGRAAGTVLASPRRYETHGVWRQQWRNIRVYLGYCAGNSPHLLAARYEARPAARRGNSSTPR